MSAPNKPSAYSLFLSLGLGFNQQPPARFPAPNRNTVAETQYGVPRFRNPAACLPLRLPGATQSSQHRLSPDSSGSASPDATYSTHSQLALSQPLQCSCHRPQSLIMCSSCGFSFTGRVRSVCPAHPSQIFLMDNDCCPDCSSTSLKEYRKV